jgi:hypothetical protein
VGLHINNQEIEDTDSLSLNELQTKNLHVNDIHVWEKYIEPPPPVITGSTTISGPDGAGQDEDGADAQVH